MKAFLVNNRSKLIIPSNGFAPMLLLEFCADFAQISISINKNEIEGVPTLEVVFPTAGERFYKKALSYINHNL